MSKASAANGAGNHATEKSVPALPPEFEMQFKICLKQQDAERASAVLREAMEATCSMRTTMMCQVVVKGVPLHDLDGKPVMEPRDSYEVVPDHPTRVRAAELAMAYMHGFPVKRSASVEARTFIPLDHMLGDSPIFQEMVEQSKGGEKTKPVRGKEVH